MVAHCMTYKHLDASARQEMLRGFADHIWIHLSLLSSLKTFFAIDISHIFGDKQWRAFVNIVSRRLEGQSALHPILDGLLQC